VTECCLGYDGKRGRRGDSKFSNRPVTFKSNRIGTSDSNSNLEALQVPSCISVGSKVIVKVNIDKGNRKVCT